MLFFLEPAYLPFSLALGLLLGLTLLELISLLLGSSLILDTDADLDLDVGEGFDLDAGTTPDIADLLATSQGFDADFNADYEASFDAPTSSGGLLTLLGVKGVPFLIWLAAFLMGFGLAGFILQSILVAVIGMPLFWPLTVILALPFGLISARSMAQVFGQLFSQNETSAMAKSSLGGLRGVVTQGTAKRGTPAEVRVQDWHDNTHYLRCEPFEPDKTIEQGTPVLTVRERIPLAERGPDGAAFHIRILDIQDTNSHQ